ncbi:MAG: 3-keto-5-aminohexanoate cleavage protein [Frankia sp.]|nr:3-keto-5-aminohexanoate cleavage protein [Frankia sp.]
MSAPTDPTPVIIEAAINGSTSRQTNPHVPVTPEEIAADAVAVFRAGAAIVHNHADVFGSDEEVAERYLAGWRPVLAEVPDALVYPTVAFGPGGEIRYSHLSAIARGGGLARVAPVDPGSLNLGGLGPDGLPAGGFVYRNPYDTIAGALELCMQLRLGPSLAIYEPGWLRTLLLWWEAGRLPAGSMLKFYLATRRGLTGTPFGLPPTLLALEAYLEILGDCPLPWAISVVGGDVCATEVARAALDRGGHLHVGLEFYAGDRTPTNAELVAEAVDLCARVGRPVATRAQAAAILGLPEPATAPAGQPHGG